MFDTTTWHKHTADLWSVREIENYVKNIIHIKHHSWCSWLSLAFLQNCDDVDVYQFRQFSFSIQKLSYTSMEQKGFPVYLCLVTDAHSSPQFMAGRPETASMESNQRKVFCQNRLYYYYYLFFIVLFEFLHVLFLPFFLCNENRTQLKIHFFFFTSWKTPTEIHLQAVLLVLLRLPSCSLVSSLFFFFAQTVKRQWLLSLLW